MLTGAVKADFLQSLAGNAFRPSHVFLDARCYCTATDGASKTVTPEPYTSTVARPRCRDKTRTVRTLYTHCMYTVHALYVHCTCTVHALYVHCTRTVRTLYMHCTRTVRTLYTHCKYTVRSLYEHWSPTVRVLYVHRASTVRSLRALSVTTVRCTVPKMCGTICVNMDKCHCMFQQDTLHAPHEGPNRGQSHPDKWTTGDGIRLVTGLLVA